MAIGTVFTCMSMAAIHDNSAREYASRTSVPTPSGDAPNDQTKRLVAKQQSLGYDVQFNPIAG